MLQLSNLAPRTQQATTAAFCCGSMRDELIQPHGRYRQTMTVSSHSLHESDLEDWVDKEIASLRQSVEGEAPPQKGPDHDAHAESARRRLHVIHPLGKGAGDPIASGVHRPPTARLLGLGQAWRFVRRRRFDIVFYGLCIALTIAVVLVAVSVGEP
jgi:hypothetical protein